MRLDILKNLVHIKPNLIQYFSYKVRNLNTVKKFALKRNAYSKNYCFYKNTNLNMLKVV